MVRSGPIRPKPTFPILWQEPHDAGLAPAISPRATFSSAAASSPLSCTASDVVVAPPSPQAANTKSTASNPAHKPNSLIIEPLPLSHFVSDLDKGTAVFIRIQADRLHGPCCAQRHASVKPLSASLALCIWRTGRKSIFAPRKHPAGWSGFGKSIPVSLMTSRWVLSQRDRRVTVF